jgi:hypothetical protein
MHLPLVFWGRGRTLWIRHEAVVGRAESDQPWFGGCMALKPGTLQPSACHMCLLRMIGAFFYASVTLPLGLRTLQQAQKLTLQEKRLAHAVLSCCSILSGSTLLRHSVDVHHIDCRSHEYVSWQGNFSHRQLF